LENIRVAAEVELLQEAQIYAAHPQNPAMLRRLLIRPLMSRLLSALFPSRKLRARLLAPVKEFFGAFSAAREYDSLPYFSSAST
jgi:hypothetical protein